MKEADKIKELLANTKARRGHYGESIQPIDLIDAMEPSGDMVIDFARGNIIKYAFRSKGQRESDLLKIIDYAQTALGRLANIAGDPEKIHIRPFFAEISDITARGSVSRIRFDPELDKIPSTGEPVNTIAKARQRMVELMG